MNSLTISILGSQIFPEILNKINLFSKYKIIPCDTVNPILNNNTDKAQIIVFFLTKENEKDCYVLLEKKLPLIIVNNSLTPKNILPVGFFEELNMPFSILVFEKKLVSLLARYNFRKSSIINIHNYILDQNERKIKKNNLELQLTEKEVNFLILFSEATTPLSRKFILKNVWNYSSNTETHTIETHIHRLRKKILLKFQDNNFIKNNDKGYYI